MLVLNQKNKKLQITKEGGKFKVKDGLRYSYLILLVYVLLFVAVGFLPHVAYGKDIRWVYVGAISTTDGLVLEPWERLMTMGVDSRGIVYYGTYQSDASAVRDLHIYKVTNILDPNTRTIVALDTLSNVGVYNQYYGIATDTANAVYFSYWYENPAPGDTAIRKYDADGNKATSFGTNGQLSPTLAGLYFRVGALTYLAEAHKLVGTGISPSPATQYTGRLVGFDANSGLGIDTTTAVDTTGGPLRFIRAVVYDPQENQFITLDSYGYLLRWRGGTPANLEGYTIDSVLKSYNSAYGVRLQLSLDTEFRQVFASVTSAVAENTFVSVYDLDGLTEIQRLTPAGAVPGPSGWCAGSCVIGSGVNKRLLVADFNARSIRIFAPETPQISPPGPITVTRGGSRTLSASAGKPPYTWSITTVAGAPGYLSDYTGAQVTFISEDTGVCIVRCTDANELYSEVVINVVPTSAPIFPDIAEATVIIKEEK